MPWPSPSAPSPRREGAARLDQPAPEASAVERIGLVLTTAAWQGVPPLALPLAALVRELAGRGWPVRRASPRNWLLWRRWRERRPYVPLVLVPVAATLSARDRDIASAWFIAPTLADAATEAALSEAVECDRETRLLLMQAIDRRITASVAGLSPRAWRGLG